MDRSSITNRVPPVAPDSTSVTDILPARPLPRSLIGWLWRYGLLGALLGPLVLRGVHRYGFVSAEMVVIVAPVLGAVVGGAGGFAGWAVSEMLRRRP